MNLEELGIHWIQQHTRILIIRKEAVMVIKDYWTHWDTYALESKLSGVLLDGKLNIEDSYMLFGKHRPTLKLARLLGRSPSGGYLREVAGPIRGHLCRYL